MRTTPLLMAAACAAGPALLAAQQPGRLNLDSLRRAVVTIHALDADGGSLASGTGFFVFYNGPEGLVVTAAHVLEGAAGCTVELASGETRRCSPTASDTGKDVIMLLVPGSPPGTLKWGWSDRAQDGDEVTVISNPLGELPGTVSKGIISASRIVGGTKLLQISAPISHGSSGAPVLNAQGQVIGIVRSTLESGQSLNFATATDIVRNMQMDPGALSEARGMMRGPVVTARPSSSSPVISGDGRPITVGQTVNGTLTDRDQLYGDTTYYQRWQFKTTPGQDVTIDLASPDFRPALILRGLDTSVVNLNGGPDCSARVSLTFPGSGPYEILVNTSSTPVRQTGRFTLTLSAGRKPVERRSGRCPPGGTGSMHAIAIGQTVGGALTNSDDLYTDTTYYQRWRFTAQPGQDLTVDLSSSDFDPEILFYGLDTIIVNDDGGPGCASRVAFTAPTSGPYVVLVNTTSTPHRQTGRFTLSVSTGKKPVDPRDTRDCQAPGAASGGNSGNSGATDAPVVRGTHSITVGQSVSGRITTSDEMWVDSTYIERWTVNGQAGQTVTIDLASADFDAYMMLKGPGVPRDHDSDDDSGGKCNARIVVTFAETGLYEIDVNTQGRKYATGAFTLSVTSGSKSKSDTPCHPS